ncbi:GTP-binding protein [Coniophora puteana RWD-64-598 SS2]|uniref:ADP-ribosylation factor-like protein 2 n=1 Tax=Coniophora puteana (strain RWD-64-598) TaxID=741705 RepID=A0A5M3MSL5_CONPW|nr:GTP-binding protein [Coniophora puteana RWD-64-598 SS2]EIW82158.1 GTP-binding protein [Coniophora puteana RWD-64-598 SS2]
MGLLTIIRKSRQKEKEMRILFLGLDNAGKTTILKKLNGEDIMRVSPTLGFNIKTFVHRNYTLNIWDVGGQRTLRPYWRNYFEQTDAIVWVVDSSDRMRMKDCKEELHSLLLEDRLVGASLLVFANKQDIAGSLTDSEIRDALDLSSIRSHNWTIWPCSAVTGDNLITGLDWAVDDVARRIYYSSTTPAFAPTTAPLKTASQEARSGTQVA